MSRKIPDFASHAVDYVDDTVTRRTADGGREVYVSPHYTAECIADLLDDKTILEHIRKLADTGVLQPYQIRLIHDERIRQILTVKERENCSGNMQKDDRSDSPCSDDSVDGLGKFWVPLTPSETANYPFSVFPAARAFYPFPGENIDNYPPLTMEHYVAMGSPHELDDLEDLDKNPHEIYFGASSSEIILRAFPDGLGGLVRTKERGCPNRTEDLLLPDPTTGLALVVRSVDRATNIWLHRRAINDTGPIVTADTIGKETITECYSECMMYVRFEQFEAMVQRQCQSHLRARLATVRDTLLHMAEYKNHPLDRA